jgi:hypothetical protein
MNGLPCSTWCRGVEHHLKARIIMQPDILVDLIRAGDPRLFSEDTIMPVVNRCGVALAGVPLSLPNEALRAYCCSGRPIYSTALENHYEDTFSSAFID